MTSKSVQRKVERLEEVHAQLDKKQTDELLAEQRKLMRDIQQQREAERRDAGVGATSTPSGDSVSAD